MQDAAFDLIVVTEPSGRRLDQRLGSAWPDTSLVFTTRTGRPVEPRNLLRTFRRICDNNQLRAIKVHHLRQTVASLLKSLGVPARDAQAILGHTRISMTLEIYTDVDAAARLEALTRLHGLFEGDHAVDPENKSQD